MHTAKLNHAGASAALRAARHRVGSAARSPWFGAAVLTPLLLLLAVGAAPPMHRNSMSDNGITPLAAVANTNSDSSTTIVAATRPLPLFRIAAPTVSAPPPMVVVNSVGSLRIPKVALDAYRNAERMMAAAAPACGISWNLLAGIGRIESLHANGGATDAHGNAVNPIYGPTLDGTLAGNETIVQSVQAGRVTYARALGPMQFLPGTWARYASDGDGDGKADVQNIFDASLAAARYLCSGGLNLRNPSQVMTAILRYNNSMAYVSNVLGWAGAYATGVEPVDLPPITASTPIGDAHLDSNPEGLGPGLPLSAVGLPANDPLAVVPMLGPNRPDTVGQLGVPLQVPLPGPSAPVQNCAIYCLQAPPSPAPPAGQNCQVFCLQSTPAAEPEAPVPGQVLVAPQAAPPAPQAAPPAPQAAPPGPQAPPSPPDSGSAPGPAPAAPVPPA